MGQALAPPPKDVRVERCIRNFSIPENKIQILWRLFCKYDREGQGYISTDDFFEALLKYPRSGLTDALFHLIETKSDGILYFGEFVEIICTFACFERNELLRYFFFILDPMKTGLVEKHELKQFIKMMWYGEVSTNLKEALDYLDEIDDGDGTFNFRELLSLQSLYPNTFYPLYKLQTFIMTHSLGELWWEYHKAQIIERREYQKVQELELIKRKKREEARAADLANDELIIKRMGYFRYYFMPWLRDKERAKLARIAAIEGELDKELKRQKKVVKT